MQNKKLILILVIVLIVGLCVLVALVGGGGAWLLYNRSRASQSEVIATELPAITQGVEAENPTEPPPATTQEPPAVPSSPTVETTEPPPNVDFNGIRFYLDTQLAQGVLPELVEAAPGNAEEAFPGEVHPEYTQFTLQGYVLKDSYLTPQLFIYPLPEYRAMDRWVDETADLLLGLLQTRPSTLAQHPFLPIWPANAMIKSKVGYVDFKNGSGVRYLTQFGQDVSPINNKTLIYTYQGITNDQQWYVAAVLPISHPSLPADVSDEGFEAAAQEGYYANIEAQLSAAADDSFVPGIPLLDALITSLRVW